MYFTQALYAEKLAMLKIIVFTVLLFYHQVAAFCRFSLETIFFIDLKSMIIINTDSLSH